MLNVHRVSKEHKMAKEILHEYDISLTRDFLLLLRVL